jgi:hypothetical protein
MGVAGIITAKHAPVPSLLATLQSWQNFRAWNLHQNLEEYSILEGGGLRVPIAPKNSVRHFFYYSDSMVIASPWQMP